MGYKKPNAPDQLSFDTRKSMIPIRYLHKTRSNLNLADMLNESKLLPKTHKVKDLIFDPKTAIKYTEKVMKKQRNGAKYKMLKDVLATAKSQTLRDCINEVKSHETELINFPVVSDDHSSPSDFLLKIDSACLKLESTIKSLTQKQVSSPSKLQSKAQSVNKSNNISTSNK